jgi:hypothetical protein
MHLQKFLAPVLLAAPQLISACADSLLPRQTESDITRNVTYPISELGADLPSDHSTLGYFINHLCIKVRNATESVEWYGKVFGLRHIDEDNGCLVVCSYKFSCAGDRGSAELDGRR